MKRREGNGHFGNPDVNMRTESGQRHLGGGRERRDAASTGCDKVS